MNALLLSYVGAEAFEILKLEASGWFSHITYYFGANYNWVGKRSSTVRTLGRKHS